MDVFFSLHSSSVDFPRTHVSSSGAMLLAPLPSNYMETRMENDNDNGMEGKKIVRVSPQENYRDFIGFVPFFSFRVLGGYFWLETRNGHGRREKWLIGSSAKSSSFVWYRRVFLFICVCSIFLVNKKN